MLLSLVWAILNNNVSLFPPSRQKMKSYVEQALGRGTEWVVSEYGREESRNPALLRMIQDMEGLSGDSRLSAIVDNFRRRFPGPNLLNPHGTAVPVDPGAFQCLQDYQRWTQHAIAPTVYVLSDEDRAAMFSPDEHHWGSLTHQLFALLVYRQLNGTSTKLDGLINRLCERVAAEEVWDFRVTDLYLQRIAFVLWAGRPDLIKRRWIERVIANQDETGPWAASWYGLGPGLLEFHLKKGSASCHATAQGLWILYMLKYRYPDWIEGKYDLE
jgi:hypothetical protein